MICQKQVEKSCEKIKPGENWYKEGSAMATNILWLRDVRFVDVAIAGGKGASLGELTWKGFPVPPGS